MNPSTLFKIRLVVVVKDTAFLNTYNISLDQVISVRYVPRCIEKLENILEIFTLFCLI